MSRNVNDIVDYLADNPISLYMHVSSVALLLTDWLFALDTEILHAWSGPWNVGRVLYFLTRYSVFVDTPLMMYYKTAYSVPPYLCGRLYVTGRAIEIFGILVAELVMTLRVWALWGNHRSIGILLLVVTTTNTAAVLATSVFFVKPQYVAMDSLSSIAPGCFPATASSTEWSFIPLVVQQTFIFALTAIKGIQYYWIDSYTTSWINAFYRNGITYYVLLIALTIVNVAVLPRYPLVDPYFLTFLQGAVHSTLSARMLLQLRQYSSGLQTYSPPTSLKFASKAPGASRMTQLEDALSSIILDDGWFGREEGPTHCVGGEAQPLEEGNATGAHRVRD